MTPRTMIRSLRPAADEELALIQEAEIARPQIGVLVIAGDAGAEGLRGDIRAVPVAASLGRAVQPDLADPPLAQRLPGFGIDDPDDVPGNGLAAAHQRGLVVVLGQGLFDPHEIFLERSLVHSQGLAPPSGHAQGIFGQAVSARQRVGPQTVRSKALPEACEGLGPERLCPDEYGVQSAQVDPGQLGRGELVFAHTVLEGEVRHRRVGGAYLADEPEPGRRPLEEVER